MKTSLYLRSVFLTTLAAAGCQVMAQSAPSLSFNAGVATEYRYRGLAQSSFKPALQGGLDYDYGNGFYAGTWASTIDWIKDDGKALGLNVGSTSLELDVYGGYKGQLSQTSGFDVGLLQYIYPGNNYANAGANANTLEAYGAYSAGVFTVKYAYSLSNLFGVTDSKGSTYLDVSAAFDLGSGMTLTPHLGRQSIAGASANLSYTDASLSLGKDLGGGISLSATAVATTNQSSWLTSEAKSKGKSALVLGLKYAF